MSVCLYRLFAVQNFNGEHVAVYVNEGNYPDPEILGDAEEISRGEITRTQLLKNKPWLYEGGGGKYTTQGLNRDRLTFYTRIITRSRKVVEDNANIDKAIFVESIDHRSWRGTRTLYHNKFFDEIKSDTPQYSGCEPDGEITL
jgi:hypothetical protein